MTNGKVLWYNKAQMITVFHRPHNVKSNAKASAMYNAEHSV